MELKKAKNKNQETDGYETDKRPKTEKNNLDLVIVNQVPCHVSNLHIKFETYNSLITNGCSKNVSEKWQFGGQFFFVEFKSETQSTNNHTQFRCR